MAPHSFAHAPHERRNPEFNQFLFEFIAAYFSPSDSLKWIGFRPFQNALLPTFIAPIALTRFHTTRELDPVECDGKKPSSGAKAPNCALDLDIRSEPEAILYQIPPQLFGQYDPARASRNLFRPARCGEDPITFELVFCSSPHIKSLAAQS